MGVSTTSTTHDESHKVENLIRSQIGSSSQHIDRTIEFVLEAYIFETVRQIEIMRSGEGFLSAYIVGPYGCVHNIVKFDSETQFSCREGVNKYIQYGKE